MLNFKVILSWYWGMKHKIAKCAVRRKEFVFFCLENASQVHESSRRNWSRRAIALRTETLALLLVEFLKTALFPYRGNQTVSRVPLVLGFTKERSRALKSELDHEKGTREIKSLDSRKPCVGNNFLIFSYLSLTYILLYYYA